MNKDDATIDSLLDWIYTNVVNIGDVEEFAIFDCSTEEMVWSGGSAENIPEEYLSLLSSVSIYFDHKLIIEFDVGEVKGAQG